jgi:hypothetical protein
MRNETDSLRVKPAKPDLRVAALCTSEDRSLCERGGTHYGVGRFFLYVFAPTALGASIYLLFRSPNLVVFRWLDAVGLRDAVMTWRTSVSDVHLPEWLLYSAPDGLWVFATTSWIIHIWRGKPPWPWLLSGVALGVGSELGQAMGIVPGTYQHEDIVVYVAGFLLALIQLRQPHEKTA